MLSTVSYSTVITACINKASVCVGGPISIADHVKPGRKQVKTEKPAMFSF